MCNVFYFDFVGKIKQEVGLLIFYVVKIFDIVMVWYVIVEGFLDMVGMICVYMVDLQIVKKIIENWEGDICLCVGVIYCLDWIYQVGDVFCIYNVVIGCEFIMLYDILKVDEKKNVVIVGVGLVGLEVVWVVFECGYMVMVFEVVFDLGGQICLIMQFE